MNVCVQILVKKIPISKSQGNEMATCWNLIIQVMQKFQDTSLEILGFRHTVEWFFADIIAD